MADIIEGGLNKSASGLKTPKQVTTVAGPGIRINNKFNVNTGQSSMKVGGSKSK